MDAGRDPLADPTARALARARAWGLLGDLLRRGLVAETVPAWQASGQLPAGPPDLDAFAAAHTRLFLIEVSPHASVFLSPDALLGGEVADAVRRDRAASGLGEPIGVEPDHLGALAAWLAFLSGAEADARRDGVDPTRILGLQRDALDRHVGSWVGVLLEALRGVEGDAAIRFHVDAVALLVALVEAQRADLGGPSRPVSLPPPVDVLAAPETGIRRIAAHLCLPAQAGGWWSRSALVAHGRRLDLPAGFGSRVDQLEGLFASAATYGRVPALCAALAADAAGWAARLGAPWAARAQATVALLERVAAG